MAANFVDEMQRLMGDDFEPDAQLLEESWSRGAPVAMQNWSRRRQMQAERERQTSSFRELNSLGSVWWEDAGHHNTEPLTSARVANVAQAYGASRPPSANTETHASGEATQDWMRPTKMRSINEAPVAECGRPGPASADTHSRIQAAFRLLGVAAGSSRRQIRDAYRRMARQWHPDQLERRTDEARQRATERMAAINEAYCLLCRGPM